MKIGDEVYIHGYVDEIRQNVVIIRNEGGYFGTVPEEISRSEIPNNCEDAVSRAIVQEEITKSIELKENPYQLWYRIRALPSVTPEPCDDAISRQAAIDIKTIAPIAPVMNGEAVHYEEVVFVHDLEKLPSVTPQQRTGRWIEQDIHNCHTDFKCSECGYIHSFMHLYGKPTADYTYCPNCGAKMEAKNERGRKRTANQKRH